MWQQGSVASAPHPSPTATLTPTQALGLPLFCWWGPWCGLNNVPRTEALTVATFDPFPASRYTVAQLGEAHAAYCAHLKACFDSRKAECGAAHKELVFIGKHQPPLRSRL